MRYCAYQERSTYEAKNKAFELGLRRMNSKLIDLLQERKFYSGRTICKAYVSGKVNVKKWGRYKNIKFILLKGLQEKTMKKHFEK